MNGTTKRRNRVGIATLGWVTLAALAAAGCSLEQDVSHRPGSAAAAGESGSPTALALERAQREVDRGANLDDALVALQKVVEDPAATADERDQARLGVSRALELKGDAEGAIRAIEDLLASHSVDHRFAARSEADRRLRKLLTGSEEDSPSLPDEEPVAPVAKALATFFGPGADGATQVDILVFGGGRDLSDRIGTFNVSGAIRQLKKELCPLCSEDLNVHTSRSRNSSWVALPMTVSETVEGNPRWSKSLAVFYYDLGTGRIPPRYDRYLPIPGARVDETLHQGKGLVAVKQRDGAPPIVLIAAPRWGQLDKVEEAFSRMTQLPAEPAAVELDAGLSSSEIQVVMRGARKQMRGCYESLLARSPDATGKLVFSYSIGPDGKVSDARLDDGTTLSEPEFQRCMLGVVGELRYPASGKTTTVKYPVSLTPER